MPWSSALSSALPARSVRTTAYGTPVAATASMAGVVGSVIASGRVDQFDADALVDAALGLVAGDLDATDFAGVGDVRPAIGLQVEPDDLDRPDLLDARG